MLREKDNSRAESNTAAIAGFKKQTVSFLLTC
jgi:hypothetical protein